MDDVEAIPVSWKCKSDGIVFSDLEKHKKTFHNCTCSRLPKSHQRNENCH